jgi:hypothetical protein
MPHVLRRLSRDKNLDAERLAHEKALDETIEGSFPASDPSSTIPDPPSDVEHTGERREESFSKPEA